MPDLAIESFHCINHINACNINIPLSPQLITATTKLGYSYVCQPVNYSDNPDELRVSLIHISECFRSMCFNW